MKSSNLAWLQLRTEPRKRRSQQQGESKKTQLENYMKKHSPPPSPTPHSNIPPTSPRQRTCSRDIGKRTYSAQFGESTDLTPEVCNRLQLGSLFNNSVFIITYLTLLSVVQLGALSLCGNASWTVTHAIHCICTLIHIHWLQGNFQDTQDDLGNWTLWEQLVALGDETQFVQLVLLVIPFVLCWFACMGFSFDVHACVFNFVLLAIETLGKLESMNGVRVLGINRRPGFDDEGYMATTDDDTTSIHEQED